MNRLMTSILSWDYGRHWRQLRAMPRTAMVWLITGLSLAIGSLWVFAEVVDEVLEAEIELADRLVLAWLHRWDPEWMPGLMYFVTKTGSAPMVITLSLAVIAWLALHRRNLHAITIFLIASLGGLLLNVLLKLLLRRPRPLIDPGLDATGWSLPSGHAMAAMIFYGFITYLLIRSRRRTWTKLLLGSAMICFTLLIGISRIYLQAHFFSDVAAGFAAGCAWLSTCILTMEFKPWYRHYFAEQPEGAAPSEAPGELPGDASA